MSNVVFIVNPVSGKGRKTAIEDIVARNLDSSRFSCSIVYTERAAHAKEIAQKAVAQGADIVVAVGGDGTVNEVASSLAGTSAALAIVPCGSGNGLARHLGIPLSPEKAVKAINSGNIESIDYGTVNGRMFFCSCGMGFDALVSHEFSKMPKRGLWGYVKCTLKEWRRYKPEQYCISGEDFSAFLLTVANTSQWGNDAFIAPGASVKDALLDIAIIKPFSFLSAASIAWRLFHRTLEKDKSHYSKIQLKSFSVTRENPGYIHIDGEPVWAEKDLFFEVHGSGLRIIH